MKKLFSLLILFAISLVTLQSDLKAQTNCPDCPKGFNVTDSFCSKIRVIAHGASEFLVFDTLRACKGSKVTYSLSTMEDPNCLYPGVVYTVSSISNGTVVSIIGNQLVIQWGNANQASVTISYTYTTSNGIKCTGSFTIQVLLASGPVASFTISPNPACFNNPTTINFNASATTNATQYYWDFGDGYQGTGISTSHNYTAPGTYCVTLIATSSSGSSTVSSSNGMPDVSTCAECTDTVVNCLTISALPGPPIDSCHGTVCAGDRATYCTSATGCGTTVWTVTGGTIIGGTVLSTTPLVTTKTGVSCINVSWGSGNPQGQVTLQITGCPNYCTNGTTISVPVIPSSTTIAGNNTPCVGNSQTYSLPAWPGTTYNWSLSGGGTITSYNTNTPNIVVNWTTSGSYVITCTYFDSSKNCGGTATITVNVKPVIGISGIKHFCSGQSTTLNAIDQSGNPVPAATSITWSVSPSGTTYNSNGVSTNVSSTSAGTYTVTASSANACNTPSVTLTVIPAPVITPIVGKDTICPGQTYVYAVSSNTPGVFNWTINNSASVTYLTANKDSAQITWASTGGPYNIIITQTSTAGNCLSNTVMKFIYTYPNPVISGSVSVCADATVPYQITNMGNLPFNWYISPSSYGTILSGQGTNQVSIKWHGNVGQSNSNVVYLHYGLCKDDSVAITINKPVLPTISASGSLCVGNGVSLTSTGTGSFSWTSPTTAYTFNGNPATGITVPGTYNVNITNYNGSGCNVTAAYIVPDIGRPTALVSASGVKNYCYPNLPNMYLVTPSGSGYSYQWYQTPGIPVGTNSSQLGVNNNSPGAVTINAIGQYSYYVVVTLNNCVVTSIPFTITVDSCQSGCNGQIDVTNITGCNPFSFSLVSLLPPGSTIVPGTTSVFYYTGGSSTIGNTTHVFDTIGYHQIQVCADIQIPGGGTTRCCKDTTVLVKLANRFLSNVNCGVVTLTDLSTVIAPCTINSHSWSVTDMSMNSVSNLIASFNNSSAASPVLTFTQSGSYIIKHIITGCACSVTATDTVTILVPNATFSVSNSCVGTPVNMNGLSFSSYLWNFGDNATSYTQNTTHAYGTAGTYTITHTVTDINGCTNTTTNLITIIPKPNCNISYSGPTTFCAGGNLMLNACAGYSGYQWYKNGVSISGATAVNYTATQSGNYHFTANNVNNCLLLSDTVNITVTQPPSATIVAGGNTCVGSSFTLTIPSCNNCNIIWSDNNSVIPGATTPSLVVNVTNANVGNHTFSVNVTDASGCVNTGTFITAFNALPTVSVNVSPNNTNICAGNTYNLTATSNAGSPVWAWTINQSSFVISTNPSIFATTAATYNVKVIDGITGCSAVASQMISPSPDLSLFPQGCDTICDTSKIFLPIGSLNGNLNNYTINWYDNAPPYTTVIGNGPSLNLTGLPLGNHLFSVIVTDNNTGCVDTSNNYQVFIKSCKPNNCNCDHSDWDTIYLEIVPVKPIAIGAGLTLPGNPLHCGDDLGESDCKQQNFILHANYSCNPASCDTNVTYQLSGPVNQSGIMPFNSAGLPAGNYTITLTGKCGNVVCKTCVFNFSIICDTLPQHNCCTNSNWINGPVIKDKDTQVETTINCGSPTQATTVYYINNSLNNCNNGLTVSAGFSCGDSTCPGTVKYELRDSATGNLIASSVNAPMIIPTTLPNGTYYVTFNGYCGDSVCKTCKFFIVKKCQKDCCENSHWTAGPTWNTTQFANGQSALLTSPILCGTSNFAINNQIGNCTATTTVTAGYSCDTACTSSVLYKLYSLPGNTLITTSTGTLTIPLNLVNGTYKVVIYGLCGDKICDSCNFTFVKNCLDCCKGSKWASGPFWVNNNTGIKTTISCGVSRFNIINTNNLCFVPFKVIGSYLCGSTTCGSVVNYEVKDSATGNTISTSIDSLLIPTSLPNGTYFVVIKAYCGGVLCATCRFTIFKNCSCDCGPVANVVAVNIITNGTPKSYKCGIAIPAISCTDLVTMTGTYACNQTGCPASYSYTLIGPNGTTNGSLPLSLNSLPPGTYYITVKAYCGGVLCKECTYPFTVLCNTTPPPCCPYNIGVSLDSNIQYSQFSSNSLLVNTAFNLTGLTGVSLTEIRAEVLSYNLSSNYENECLKCLTYPCNWASINQGSFIPSALFPGKINLFNGLTTTTFNPTGSGLFQNPREIVWNNSGLIFAAPNSIVLNFLLPPAPIIDCCILRGEICVKFTFRDSNCRECDVTKCLTYTINKNNQIIFAMQ